MTAGPHKFPVRLQLLQETRYALFFLTALARLSGRWRALLPDSLPALRWGAARAPCVLSHSICHESQAQLPDSLPALLSTCLPASFSPAKPCLASPPPTAASLPLQASLVFKGSFIYSFCRQASAGLLEFVSHTHEAVHAVAVSYEERVLAKGTSPPRDAPQLSAGGHTRALLPSNLGLQGLQAGRQAGTPTLPGD